MADFDDLLAPSEGGTFDTLLAPAAGIRQKPRSALGEIGTGLRTGVTEGLPLQAGQAMQWLGEPTGGGFRQSVYEKGKSIADAAKARQELPENKLRPGEHGAVVNSLAEGGEMLAPSLAPPLAVAAGLALLPEAVGASALAGGAATALRFAPKVVQAVSKLAPLAVSSAVGAVPAAMQAGQQTLESVQGAGASDEVARAAGWKNLFIEGVGETAGTAIGGKFAGLAGKTLGKATKATIAGTIKAATDTAVWKPFAKGLVNTAIGEVGTELGQAGLQASVEREAGVDVDPLEQMKSVVGPTLGMTAFLAPFGLHANYSNARSAKAVNTIIEDPTSATPEQRQAVVEELHKQAVANKVPDADEWLTGAKEDIAAGLPIRRVANVIREEQAEPADPATNTVQAETLNQATPEEVKIDKVEDGVATVTVGDRTVELPVKEAAEAVASGNLEEVLAEKEAKPVVEELPMRPSAPTSTNLAIGEEVWSYLPPVGKTIQDVQAETAEMSPAEKRAWFEKNEAESYRNKVAEYEVKQSRRMSEVPPLEEQVASQDEVGSETNDILFDLADQAVAAQDEADIQKRRVAFERLQAGAELASQEVRNGNLQQDSAQVAGADTLQTGDGLSSQEGRNSLEGSPAQTGSTGGQNAQLLPQEINDEFSVPEEPAGLRHEGEGATFISPTQSPEEVQARLAETEAKFAPKEQALSGGDFESLDTLSETATKQTITTGDLFATLEQSPDENVKKLGGFLKSFTPGSKLETAVKVDPTAKVANYLPGKNELTVKDLKNAPTSLHELVHSVTVRELKIRPDMQKRVREVMALVKVQVTQLGLISKDTISNIEIAGGSKTFKNKFLAGELSGMEQIGYGLLNEQEFLAQAFSSPQFQGVLKATQIKTGGKYRSAWDALVEKVMQVLGIEAKHASAFSEALSIAAQLASTEVSAPLQAQSAKGGIASRSGQGTFVARVQQDLKKFLGKGYDNLVKRGKLEVVRNANDLPQQMQRSALYAWATPQQQVSSASTSISYPDPESKSPIIFSAFRKGEITLGPTNADIGGGRFDQITDWLRSKGVTNIVWDRFNRTEEHNKLAESLLRGGQADTATVSNVLNVIPERSGRIETISTAYDAVKPGGEVFFSMYTAPKAGEVKGRDAYQTGMKPAEYKAEIEEVFGAGSVRKQGNLLVAVKSENVAQTLYAKSGKIAGSYFPSQKKVFLFSDNLKPGDAVDVMRHEAGHALLNEDKLFRAKRTAILKDFAYLAKTNPKIREAFAKVPTDTAKGFRGEEALMYWLQEPANRKHSIFKRIISAVKAALYRLGVGYGRLSESDLVALFSQGTKAWSRREQDQDLTKGRTLGEVLGEFAQDAKLSVKEAGRKIQGLDAFKKWFGDSKVVDENGEPLVVYHGTNASDFSTFDTKTPEASWFSADPSYASEYADGEEDARLYPVYLRLTNPFDFGFRDTLTRVTIADMASRVKQGVLDSFAAGRIGKDEARKLVADLDDVSRRKVHVGVYSPVYQWWQGEFALTDALRAAGYDGIVAREGGKSQYPTFAVFEPTQIKSIFNRGTWSQTDPDILFSKVSDKMKEGQAKIDQILDAVQNPKSRLRDIYVKYAPQWLAVTPRSHLAQTLGKRIHWLADIDTHNKKMEAIKAQLPDDFYAIYQDAESVAKKNSGLKAFNNLLLTGTFNQMTPWLDLEEQDWYGKSLVETEKAWKKEGMAKTTGKSFAEAYQEVRTAWNGLKPAEQEQVKKIVGYLASLRERERNNLLAVLEASSEGNPTLREQLMTQFNATFSKLRGIYVPLSRYGDYILKFTTKDGREQTEFFMSPGERRVFRKQMEAQGVDPDTFVEDVKRETQKGEAVIPQALREQLGKALEAKYLTGVDLEDAGAVSEAQARAADAFSDLNQVILRWMPETSALKNSIHRKNVLGASTDMLRSSMDYVLRHAGSIAWMEYGRKIEADIQGFEEETKGRVKERKGSINTDMRTHLVNDARRWFQAVKNERVSPIASTLGKFSTAYYMTSPSTFLVQLTQLPVLTLPALSRKFASYPKAAAALAEGLQKAFSKKYSKDAMYGDADVNRVYADLHMKVTEKNRVGDRQLGEDFYSPAEKLQKIKGLGTGKEGDYKRELLALRESLARGDLDISAVHEASDIAQGKQTTAVGKVLQYAMLPMQHGELGSRKATVLSTYKLATDAKQDFFSAMDASSEVVGGTLYNYAKSDKGWFMQGDTVRTLTTFQTYRIKTALRMGILLMQSLKGESPEVKKEAFKEFLGVTAMSASLAGVHGTIIGSMIFGLANLFGGDDDEPYDAVLEFNNWANERLGDLFGGILSYGLPTAFGVNASKRIGMGDLYGVSSEPPENMHGAQLAAWYAGNLIGPSFSVAQSWVKGYDQMANKGNYMRGLEEALPKPLKDGLKAIRVASDGLKTGAGKKLLADEAIGPDEILMIGLGFQPDEVAKAQGAERSLNKIGTQLSERRGRLIRDAAKAIVESEDTEGPMAAIATFNAKLPLFAINGSDLRPAVRRLVLGEVGTTGLRQRQVASQFGVQTYMGE